MAPPGPALLCRGSIRVPSGPEAPTLKSHDRARYDWDVVLGRIWVRVLLVGFFVPIGIRLHDEMRWIWPWTGLSDLGLARLLDDAAPDTVWMPLEEEAESEPEAD